MENEAADLFTIHLRWNRYEDYVNASVVSLLRAQSVTDITLMTLDRQTIPAHRFVLSSCSTIIKRHFDGIPPSKRNVILIFPFNISNTILKVLVEYMYNGKVTLCSGQLVSMLKAAQILGITGLCREDSNVETNNFSPYFRNLAQNKSKRVRIVQQTWAPFLHNNEIFVDDDESSNAVRIDVSPPPPRMSHGHVKLEKDPLQSSDIVQNSNRSSEEGQEKESNSVENSSAKSAQILGITGLCREDSNVETKTCLYVRNITQNKSKLVRIVRQTCAPFLPNNEIFVDDESSNAVRIDVSPPPPRMSHGHVKLEKDPLQSSDIVQNSNRSSEEGQEKESNSVENSSAKSGPSTDE